MTFDVKVPLPVVNNPDADAYEVSLFETRVSGARLLEQPELYNRGTRTREVFISRYKSDDEPRVIEPTKILEIHRLADSSRAQPLLSRGARPAGWKIGLVE